MSISFSIQYGLVSAKDILRKSKCELYSCLYNECTIWWTDQNTSSSSSSCCEHTIVDPRLGPRWSREVCMYCKKQGMYCNCDVMGHIRLPFPIVWTHFVPHILKEFRNSLCVHCFHVKKKKKLKRIEEIGPSSSSSLCESCGNPASTAGKTATFDSKTGMFSLNGEVQSNVRIVEILARSTRPTLVHAFCTVLPVLKSLVRPFQLHETEMKPHALTIVYHELMQFLKKHKWLPHSNEEEEQEQQEVSPSLVSELYHRVNAFAKKQTVEKSQLSRGGTVGWEYQRAVPGILDQLGGRDGAFREVLHGKRVDFTARSVITSNPYLKIDEVGIPKKMASLLTIRERIHRYNIDWRKHCLVNGRIQRVYLHRGHTTTVYRVIESNTTWLVETLCIGDEVDRFLENGDVVVFGRQPTLHTGSMLGFTVHLVDGLTLQMNVDVTPPFNADFDGDCMWIVVPQSLSARADVQEIMHVSHHLRDANGKRQYGLIQNALWGAQHALHSNQICPLVYMDCALLMATTKTTTTTIKTTTIGKQSYGPPALWVRSQNQFFYTGYQLLSLALPESLNVYSETVYIRNGILIWMDASADIQTLLGYVPDVCFFDCLWRIRNMMNIYITRHTSFSLGLRDCIVPSSSVPLQSIDEAIHHVKKKTTSSSMVTNRIAELVEYGVKGKWKDLTNMSTYIGAPMVGAKPLRRFVNHIRVLPVSAENEIVIERGFLQGLTPVQMFALACKARHDVTARALLTAETGYLSREVNHLLLPLRKRNDRSIRTDENHMVQFPNEEEEEKTVFSVLPEEAVGLLAASAIGAPLTQSVLDTFHCSDSQDSTSAVVASATLQDLLQHESGEGMECLVPFHDEEDHNSEEFRLLARHIHILPDGLETHPSYVNRFFRVFPQWSMCLFTRPVVKITFGPRLYEFDILLKKLLLLYGVEEFYLSDSEYDPVFELQLSYSDYMEKLSPYLCVFDLDRYPVLERANHNHHIRVSLCSKELFFSEFVPTFQLYTLQGVEFTSCARVVSNTLSLLGIEAARAALVKELRRLLPNIQDTHLRLLADTMTSQGTVHRATYSTGISQQTTSTMGLASFEHAVETLVKSAILGKEESASHPLFQLISGQKVSTGTNGDFDIRQEEEETMMTYTPAPWDA
jgi:DNA-directed RNA polymerase beta' subunit